MAHARCAMAMSMGLFVWATAGVTAKAAGPDVVLQIKREVLIYSVGGAGATLKEKRSGFVPRPLDLPGAKALRHLPDHERLAAAYWNSYLECDEASVDAQGRERWVRRLADDEQTMQNHLDKLMAAPLMQDLVVVFDRTGGRPVVLNRETGRKLPGSPCGAGSRFVRLSPDGKRLAIASSEFKKIDIQGGGWSPSESGWNLVRVIDLSSSDRPAISVRTEDVPVDVHLPDTGGWLLLSRTDGFAWWNPIKWLPAVAGHPESRSSVFLRTFDASGALQGEQKIVSGVVVHNARFTTAGPP